MSGPEPTKAVLAEEIQRAIGGRRVRAAVFTTFSFDPSFFEEHALPVLFGHAFHTESPVRLAQLEQALRAAGPVSVYYDASALQKGALSPVLDVRRFDVRWARGAFAFHPKVLLALVDDPRGVRATELAGDAPRSLVVAASSANLTREGWWENVECAHVEEIRSKAVDRSASTVREGVLALVSTLAEISAGDDPALAKIREFLGRETSADASGRKGWGRRTYARLHAGATGFFAWLERFAPSGDAWSLEVISPFLDEELPGTLERLLDRVGPRACRIALPVDRASGAAAITRRYHEGVVRLRERFDVRWGQLPEDLRTHAKATATKAAIYRRVHAKVYRFWRADEGRSVVVVGSVNLTKSGTAPSRGGNLEVAYLVEEQARPGRVGWWLDLLAEDPRQFAGVVERDDEPEMRPIAVSLRYDWFRKAAYVRVEESLAHIGVSSCTGERLFEIQAGGPRDEWVGLTADVPAILERHLRSSSFVKVTDGMRDSVILVREDAMGSKPSVVLNLTPEQILLYWSLLTPDQRAAFIEERMLVEGTLDGILPAVQRPVATEGNSLFDRCAGLYHAFESLRTAVGKALAEGRVEDATTRLYGEKFDSLPVLLDRVKERTDADPVPAYLTCLCAMQIDDEFREPIARAVRATAPSGSRRMSGSGREALRAQRVDVLLPALERRLRAESGVSAEYLSWFTSAFVKRVPPEEQSE